MIRIGIAHDVAVDVAASGDRVEQNRIDRLQGRLQIRLDDSVELDRLPRRQPHRVVAVVARDAVERQPLRGREDAARNANAQHEGKCLLHFLAGALGPQIAIVLQVHAMEFHQLRVILGNGAGDLLAQALGQRTAQIVARLFDALVA